MIPFDYRGTIIYSGSKAALYSLLKGNSDLISVYTLIKSSEGSYALGNAVNDDGYDWNWYPLTSFTVEYSNKKYDQVVHELVKHIDNNSGPLALHCSKGIHRTCSTLLNLFRHYGMTREEATSYVMSVRPDVPWDNISIS